MINLEKLCTEVLHICKVTGTFIKNQQTKLKEDSVKEKDTHSYVTFVDTSAEEMIVSQLKELLPEAAFLTEEETVEQESKEYTWIIDPLDGTTNYIHGLTPYAISIALTRNNNVVLGVIHEIGLNETFYTWEGGKSYMNGKVISVSRALSIADSLIATGFPYYDYKRINPFLQTLSTFMQKSHGVRRLGSAATDLAYVACGRFDAFYEYSLNPWDVAAGALIVQNAGGRVCDFKGEDNYIFGKEIIATNANVFSEFQSIIANTMNE